MGLINFTKENSEPLWVEFCDKHKTNYWTKTVYMHKSPPPRYCNDCGAKLVVVKYIPEK